LGRDAVRDLRAWQRQAAGAQEQALRATARAWRRCESLDAQRVAAGEALGATLEDLASTGVTREQAAFLGVELGALSARRSRAKRGPAETGTGE
jgi:hypothetical protein